MMNVRQRAHRAVTLIEMLIALALLLAMAALVYPVIHTRLANAQFDESMNQIIALLRQARAEAQQIGRPVVVEYDPAERALAFHVLRDDASGEDTGLFGDQASIDPSGFGSSRAVNGDTSIIGFEGDRATRSAFRSNTRLESDGAGDFGENNLGDMTERARETAPVGGWRSLVLPLGVRVWSADQGSSHEQTTSVELAPATLRSEEFDRSVSDSAVESVADFAPGSENAAPMRLAIYMPDGSVLGNGFTIINTRDGSRRRIQLNQWTGVADTSSPESMMDDGDATLIGTGERDPFEIDGP